MEHVVNEADKADFKQEQNKNIWRLGRTLGLRSVYMVLKK